MSWLPSWMPPIGSDSSDNWPPKMKLIFTIFRMLKYCPRQNYYWINSGKGGSSNSEDFFTGINSFQTESSNLPLRRAKPEYYWLRSLIQDRAYPAKKFCNFQKFIPGNIFPDPLFLLVPTVFKTCSHAESNLRNQQYEIGTPDKELNFRGFSRVCNLFS